MKTESHLWAYLKAQYETLLAIVFGLLDLATVLAIVRYVVDDWREGLLVAAFFIAVHTASYIVFRSQRSEIARLEEQIAGLKARQPDLDLFLRDDGELLRRMQLHVAEGPEEPDFDGLVQREAEELRDGYREAKERDDACDNSPVADIVKMATGRELKSQPKYEEDCSKYLDRYRGYLVDLYAYETCTARLRSVGFGLDNIGNVPADGVVVLVDFPDQLRVPTEEESLELQFELEKPPKPPRRPSPFSGLGLEALEQYSVSRADSILPPITPPHIGPRNTSGPIVEHGNGARVRYEVDELLHGFTVELNPVQFFVSEQAIGNEWELQFEIHARQLHRGIQGELLVEVDSEQA